MRWVSAAALALLGLALFGLRADESATHRSVVRVEPGLPAHLYAAKVEALDRTSPSGTPRVPTAVLLHDLGGDPASLGTLARRLRDAGYAVLVPELPGHRHNRNRLIGTDPLEVANQWQSAVDASVVFVRSSPAFDAERTVLMGYGAGALAALEYASVDPSLAAVVAISGGRPQAGPYAPPNVLGVWASGDRAATREAIRRMGAAYTSLEQLVVDRVYGDLERGSAIKLTEIAGTRPLGLLNHPELGRRVVDWLSRIIRTPAGPATPDRRRLWTGVGIAAVGLILFGIAPALARRSAELTSPARSEGTQTPSARFDTGWIDLGIRLGAAPAALALGFVVASASALLGSGPLDFIPLIGARELLLALAVAGTIRLAWRRDSVPELRECAAALPGALALALPVLIGLGAVVSVWTTTALPGQRGLVAALGSLLAFPFLLSLELDFRTGSPLRASAISALVRILCLAVGAAMWFFEWLEPGAGLILAKLAIVWLGAEAVAARAQSQAPHPALMAWFQALWIGWLCAAASPLTTL